MAVDLVTGTFEPHVGDAFHATPTYEGEPLDLVLSDCVESPHARPDHPAFSLFFEAADRDRREQQTFTLTHSELGELELFLVPVSPRRYEAVIN